VTVSFFFSDAVSFKVKAHLTVELQHMHMRLETTLTGGLVTKDACMQTVDCINQAMHQLRCRMFEHLAELSDVGEKEHSQHQEQLQDMLEKMLHSHITSPLEEEVVVEEGLSLSDKNPKTLKP
jgi:hypothetical protein